MRKLKNFSRVIIAIAMMLISTFPALTHDFEVDSIYYKITSSTDKTVAVTYQGNYSSYTNEYIDKVIIPETVTYSGIIYSVTSIGRSAFEGCNGLTSVTIPNSATSIDGYAFYGCDSLTSITIPNSVSKIGERAFQGCSSLTEVNIADLSAWCKLEFDSEFDYPLYCSTGGKLILNGVEITNLIIPSDITEINAYAFYRCTSLTSVTIHNSVTSIGEFAFMDCPGLTSVSIGNSVTTIGESAFEDCLELTSISIGNSVTTIGSYAFMDCSGLTSVTIPNTVTKIGDSAFNNCAGLTEVSIGNSVTTIGSYAFMDCSGLTSVTIPNTVTKIGNSAFNGCSGLTSITIPDSLTSIESYCFYRCANLRYVKIGASVKSIGSNAFAECGNLCQLEIPEGVETIGSYAFNNTGLPDYIELPSTITSIASAILGEYANTKVVKINATTPPTLGSKMSASLVIVPEGSGDAYKNHETWGKYTIVEGGTNIAEVTVSQPGYLAVDIVEQAELAPAKVTKLIVHGKINQTDFNVMKSNMLNCYSIDLSDAECDTIPNDAFNGKNYLVDIKLPKKCNVIGNSAFYNCCIDEEIALPEDLTSIGSNAFYKTGIKGTLTIPSTVSYIGSNAFESCYQLTEVDLSGAKEMKTINPSTFIYASRLQTVSLPETLETIGKMAFQATAIKELVTPSELKEIGVRAFQDCHSLNTIDMSNSTKLTTINDYAFWLNGNTSEIIFSESLEHIGSLAFGNNSSLCSINLPASLKTIWSEAFKSCSSLKYADLSKTQLTGISSKLFQYCSALEIVNLPATITNVYGSAFYDCANLKNISVPCVTPPTVADTYSFSGVDKETCVLSIPTNSYVDYLISEHWGAFVELCKGIIVEKDENVDVFFRRVTADEIAIAPDSQYKYDVKASVVDVELADSQEYGAVVPNGTSVYAKNNGSIKFILDVAEGYEVSQVLYNDEDVTDQVVNNTYITPAVTVKGTLKVATGIPAGIEEIETETETDAQVEAVEVARYDIHGRLLSEPIKGINIVKYSDGTVKKIVIN